MKSLVLALPVAFAAVAAPTTAAAIDMTRAGSGNETNAEVRINLSGKLRMLSQRIPSAACHLSRGIDVENASALIATAPAEFEKILTALEFGDPELNIVNPETRKKSIIRIHALREKWEPLKMAADAVAAGTASDADLDYILSNNMEVLGAAVELVLELTKQYSSPGAMTEASAMLIDISGRQRMLTQKMSKESCMLGTDFKTDSTLSDLEGTMTIFEASLNALRHGMPAVGVLPPPNGDISNGLEVVVSDWQTVKPYLVEVANGTNASEDMHAAKFQMLNMTMANMNKVVGMYAEAAN